MVNARWVPCSGDNADPRMWHAVVIDAVDDRNVVVSRQASKFSYPRAIFTSLYRPEATKLVPMTDSRRVPASEPLPGDTVYRLYEDGKYVEAQQAVYVGPFESSAVIQPVDSGGGVTGPPCRWERTTFNKFWTLTPPPPEPLITEDATVYLRRIGGYGDRVGAVVSIRERDTRGDPEPHENIGSVTLHPDGTWTPT
jgi:hypothetical protein